MCSVPSMYGVRVLTAYLLHTCQGFAYQQGQVHLVSALWRQGKHWSVPCGSCSSSPLRANYSVVSKDTHEPCRAPRAHLAEIGTGRHRNPRSREARLTSTLYH
ncbi:hypothetical protein V8C37DRAFT_385496 [Trichoderma ceciliae]